MTVAKKLEYIKADLSNSRRGLQRIYRQCTKFNPTLGPIIDALVEFEKSIEAVRRLAYHDKDLQQFDLGFGITKARDTT